MATTTETAPRTRKTPAPNAKTTSEFALPAEPMAPEAEAILPVRLKDMQPALLEKFREIEALFRSTRRDDAIARYQIGRHIADLKGGKTKYGEGAVARVAEALGLKAKTLYAYSLVAEAWTEAPFRDLVSRQGAYGTGLPFTIFLDLASVEDPALRQKWLDLCLREALPTKKLRSLIKKASAKKKTGPKFSGEELAIRLERQAEKRLQAVQKGGDELLATFVGKPLTPAMREQLRKAAAHEQALLEVVQRHVARLKELLGVDADTQATVGDSVAN